jgi:periplasmic protein TonB
MSAVMSGDQNHRSIHYAVLASILLHGLLLFGYSPRDSSRRAESPAPILARLVEPAPAPAPAVTPPAAPQPRPEKPKAQQPREKPPAPALAKPAPVPQPVAKAAPQEAVAPPSPVEQAVPEAPAAPPAVAKIDPAPSAPAAAPAMDAGSLDQYRLQLIGIARKYKRYPRVAIDNNWEGDVVVRMVIGANGMISSVSIKTSSGHAVLDQQALEMFRKAKPLVPIPPALRGKEFTVEVRANYNLKDGQDSG